MMELMKFELRLMTNISERNKTILSMERPITAEGQLEPRPESKACTALQKMLK